MQVVDKLTQFSYHIADLLILDSPVIIVIHTKHVKYTINQNLTFGW